MMLNEDVQLLGSSAYTRVTTDLSLPNSVKERPGEGPCGALEVCSWMYATKSGQSRSRDNG